MSSLPEEQGNYQTTEHNGNIEPAKNKTANSCSNKLQDVVSNMLWRYTIFSSQILIKLGASVW